MNSSISEFGSFVGGGHGLCPSLAGVDFHMTASHVKRRGWPNVLFIKEYFLSNAHYHVKPQTIRQLVLLVQKYVFLLLLEGSTRR